MVDHNISEQDNSVANTNWLVENARAGNYDAICAIVNQYVDLLNYAASVLVPITVDKFQIVCNTLVSFILNSPEYTNEDQIQHTLVSTLFDHVDRCWHENQEELESYPYLRSLKSEQRNHLLITKSREMVKQGVADFIQIKANDLPSTDFDLEYESEVNTELEKFFQAPLDRDKFSQEQNIQICDSILEEISKQRRSTRIQVFTLETIWGLLGVIILVLAFVVLSNMYLPAEETDGISGPIPEESSGSGVIEPTRTPFPYENTQANGASYSPEISGDGRFVVFVSEASNLVPDDKNGFADIFIIDLITNEIKRIKPIAMEDEIDGPSSGPDISDDGKFVSFVSWATNLTGDLKGSCRETTEQFRPCADVYVWDRESAQIELISQDRGVPGNGDSGINPQSANPAEHTSISGDGRYVSFFSLAENLGADPLFGGLMLFDRSQGEIHRLDQAIDGNAVNGVSYWPSLNADGSLIAFSSFASNLVDDDLNSAADIFVFDQLLNQILRVTTGPAGTGAGGSSVMPSIAADGSLLVFRSEADDLVPDDFNNTADIFLHNLQSGITSLVSASSAGSSADRSSNLPDLAADGNFVSFASQAQNLNESPFNGTWNVYYYTQSPRRVYLASAGMEGFAANGPSSWPKISGDGAFIVFVSSATNLVPNDLNGVEDIFLYETNSRILRRINLPPQDE